MIGVSPLSPADGVFDIFRAGMSRYSAFFGVQVLFGILKVKKLDQREKLITGTT